MKLSQLQEARYRKKPTIDFPDFGTKTSKDYASLRTHIRKLVDGKFQSSGGHPTTHWHYRFTSPLPISDVIDLYTAEFGPPDDIEIIRNRWFNYFWQVATNVYLVVKFQYYSGNKELHRPGATEEMIDRDHLQYYMKRGGTELIIIQRGKYVL